MSEDYVSFEVAKLLKEKGFPLPSTNFRDWLCCMYDENGNIHWGSYDKNWYFKITHQIAMKWLREVHNIQIELNWDKGNQLYSFQIWKPGKYQPEISSLDLWRIYKDDNYLGEWNYEEAVESALKYCLENLI